MIVAAVLAAGEARRFGSPKQLARIDGESLLHRASRAAVEWSRNAGDRGAIVILGAHADQLRGEVAEGAEIVVNQQWSDGLSTSIHAAVHAARDASALLITLADQPGVGADELEAITRVDAGIVAASYEGTRGVPALFRRSHFPALLALRGDVGAKSLLHDAATVALDAARWDVDQPHDLALQ